MATEKKWVSDDDDVVGIVGYVGLGSGAEGEEGPRRRIRDFWKRVFGFGGLGN